MINDVLQLMLKSDMHRDWYVSDLERLVLPAIEAKKMTVVYENKITSKTAIYPRPTGPVYTCLFDRRSGRRIRGWDKKVTARRLVYAAYGW